MTDYEEGTYLSPDKNLELSAFVNRTDETLDNYALVELTVFNRSNAKTTKLTTGIGAVMKWAVDWYANDTIVAQSSDIGTHAWHFSNDEFIEIEVSREMHAFAEALREEKYF
ncbi:MAG: hypothetical protein Roseis2KO_09030 [Roseivirga sp.]